MKYISEKGNKLIDYNILSQLSGGVNANNTNTGGGGGGVGKEIIDVTSGASSSSSSSSSYDKRQVTALAPASTTIAADKEYNIDDPEFVKSLIALHDEYSDIIIKYFQSHNLLQNALKDAFVSFMNRDLVGSLVYMEWLGWW